MKIFGHDKYAQVNEESDLNELRMYDKIGVRLTVRDDKIEPALEEIARYNERKDIPTYYF